jgi:hypothetical protein
MSADLKALVGCKSSLLPLPLFNETLPFNHLWSISSRMSSVGSVTGRLEEGIEIIGERHESRPSEVWKKFWQCKGRRTQTLGPRIRRRSRG